MARRYKRALTGVQKWEFLQMQLVTLKFSQLPEIKKWTPPWFNYKQEVLNAVFHKVYTNVKGFKCQNFEDHHMNSNCIVSIHGIQNKPPLQSGRVEAMHCKLRLNPNKTEWLWWSSSLCLGNGSTARLAGFAFTPKPSIHCLWVLQLQDLGLLRDFQGGSCGQGCFVLASIGVPRWWSFSD